VFLAFIAGLSFDTDPHDEYFLGEYEVRNLTSLNFAAPVTLIALLATPLDQFSDVCAGLPFLDGDFINLLPAIFCGLTGGTED